METEYQIRVLTNSYAGNFERELCAFMTGHTGECGVGSDLVLGSIRFRFENKILSRPDDNGCYRPVALDPLNVDNIIIFLEEQLSPKDMIFLTERAMEFEVKRPYEYLDKNFKFLGIQQLRINTKKEIEII